MTPQAVSKWENGTGLPDISQIVPLSTFSGISSDILLGITTFNQVEEINDIINKSWNVTVKEGWKLIQKGLKKYPTNLKLLQRSVELGCCLSYKENDTYDENDANHIYKETARQVDLIVKYSNNENDILRAHMIMVLLHSSFDNIKDALEQASHFPFRADMIESSMCAFINHSLKNYKNEQICLQRSLEMHLFASIDSLVYLGQSYENTFDYDKALKMYFVALDLISYIFKDDDYIPSIYKVESGNIYAFIARTYLKMNQVDNCLNYLDKMVDNEIFLKSVEKEKYVVKNSFLDKANVVNYANYRNNTTALDSLNLDCFDSIKDNEIYKEIIKKANNK